MTARKVSKKIVDDTPQPLTEVEEMLAQLDGNSIVAKIQRENPATKRWDHLGRIEPVTAEFLDDVKAVYGGGNYRIRLYDGSTYIKNGYRAFSIGGKPKDPDDDTRTTPKVEKPARNGIEWAKDIAAVVVPVATAIGLVMKEIRAGSAPANSGADVLTTLQLVRDAEESGERRGKEIGKLQAERGDGERSGTMLDVAKEFAGPFMTMLANKSAQSAPAVQTIPAPAPPPHQLPPSMPNAPTLPPEYSFLLPIRPHYPLLAAQAQSDTHPQVIADFVLAKMTPDDLHAIHAAVMRTDFFDTMRAELFPIHERYPDWLATFLERIVEVSTEDDADDEPPPKPKPSRKKNGGQ